jgi:hypothetical protein
MTQNVALTLQTLRCIREKNSSSTPYIWTDFLWIDNATATVGTLPPLVGDDRVVLSNDLHPGQSATIPASVGSALRPFDTDLTNTTLIQVTALWQKHDTPANVVDAGFQAFDTSLHDAIVANLFSLASPDPQTQQEAVDKVQTTVAKSITDAISNSLSTVQKGEIAVGLLTLDATVDSSSTVFRNIASQPFTITLGDPLGGRLLFYRDHTQDGTGDVNTPSVIGLGGWAGFKFLFSGGNGIIYAVDQQGQLLFYRDHTQDGTGDVNTPSVIGLGGWAGFKFLFSGGNGIIYAVEDDLNPDHHYEIDGTLQVTIASCQAEIASVSAAFQAVSDLKSQIAELQSELSQAPHSERAFLIQQIHEIEQNLAPANAALDAAKQALAACQASNATA